MVSRVIQQVYHVGVLVYVFQYRFLFKNKAATKPAGKTFHVTSSR